MHGSFLHSGVIRLTYLEACFLNFNCFKVYNNLVFSTARPRGTLSTWPKKYSVPQNDLSWGTMYVLPCQTITKSVYLGVSTLY